MVVLTNYPLASIIILNYNGKNYLNNCILSVLATKYPNFEIILVDNLSSDSSIETAEIVFRHEKRLRIFRSDQNLGFSAGNNLGFIHAKGQYIIFLNSDTTVDPYWLDYLIDAMEKDQTIGLAQSLILSIDGKRIGDAGWLWSKYLLFLHPLGRDKKGNFQFIPVFEISFASGCSMIARRSLLNETGLFDGKIPFNYDDILLSLKVWLSGKRVVTVSNSIIYHIGGAATSKYRNIYSVAFSNLRAKLLLTFDLYFNVTDLLKTIFVLYFSFVMNFVVSVKRRQSHISLAIIHVTIWVIKNFKYVWTNRLAHWRKSRISSGTLIEKMIRIQVHFPLDIIPSKLSNQIRRNEIIDYENKITMASNH